MFVCGLGKSHLSNKYIRKSDEINNTTYIPSLDTSFIRNRPYTSFNTNTQYYYQKYIYNFSEWYPIFVKLWRGWVKARFFFFHNYNVFSRIISLIYIYFTCLIHTYGCFMWKNCIYLEKCFLYYIRWYTYIPNTFFYIYMSNEKCIFQLSNGVYQKKKKRGF